jgi:hypothetical protein
VSLDESLSDTLSDLRNLKEMRKSGADRCERGLSGSIEEMNREDRSKELESRSSWALLDDVSELRNLKEIQRFD